MTNDSRGVRVMLGAILVVASLLVFSTLIEAVGGAQPRQPHSQPNIVFILADDLGYADVGFTGGREIRTPHLDALAASGARLDHFYVQPVCSPTRAALMTGRYPMRYGLQVGVVRPWAQYGLPLEERTLPQALKAAGYATALVGKWHLGHFERAYLPTERGFDRQYGHYNGAIDYFTHIRDGGFDWHRDDRVSREEGYSTHLLAREAVSFIREVGGTRPFFLDVSFNAPHAPFQAPDEAKAAYASLSEPRRTYAAMITAMDEAVGQILAALDEKGLRENTLIVFSSDNGGVGPGKVADNGIFRAGKTTVYEGGVRVAAFAAWKGRIAPATRVTQPLHMVDWYPTLLRLAGASPEQKLPIDGRDAWPTIADAKPSPHQEILLNATPRNGAIRVGDWKLVLNGQHREVPDFEEGRELTTIPDVWELFNLADDPSEQTNLADKHPGKLKELRARYVSLAAQAVPPKIKPRAPDFKPPAVWGEQNSELRTKN
jgi:arylsulfatase A-like enzyme